MASPAASKAARTSPSRSTKMPDARRVPPGCSSQAITWFECAATDLSQCECDQTSLQLNCRGSYLSSDGPARCMSEYQAYDNCVN